MESFGTMYHYWDVDNHTLWKSTVGWAVGLRGPALHLYLNHPSNKQNFDMDHVGLEYDVMIPKNISVIPTRGPSSP